LKTEEREKSCRGNTARVWRRGDAKKKGFIPKGSEEVKTKREKGKGGEGKRDLSDVNRNQKKGNSGAGEK